MNPTPISLALILGTTYLYREDVEWTLSTGAWRDDLAWNDQGIWRDS